MSLQLEPDLEPIEEELLNKHFKRKHGADAYYGQTPDPRTSEGVSANGASRRSRRR
jgi:hypothetical protein